jgi:hypothetical protein
MQCILFVGLPNISNDKLEAEGERILLLLLYECFEIDLICSVFIDFRNKFQSQ